MTTSTALPSQIQELLEQRAQHTAAIVAIEATLARVTAALGSGGGSTAKAAPVAKATTSKAAPARRPGRPKAGATGLTANEFVLGFVKSHKNPTSQDISKAWKDAGRNGTSDNALSVLTKAGKLNRQALGVGIRGSRYMVA